MTNHAVTDHGDGTETVIERLLAPIGSGGHNFMRLPVIPAAGSP